MHVCEPLKELKEKQVYVCVLIAWLKLEYNNGDADDLRIRVRCSLAIRGLACICVPVMRSYYLLRTSSGQQQLTWQEELADL